MSRTSPPKIPAYRLHKATGLAVVRLNGRDVYLGRHGTAESRERYERAIAEWLERGRRSPAATAAPKPSVDPLDLRISELLAAYLGFARDYYVKDGRPTGEYSNMRDAARPLAALYAELRCVDFGPLALRAVREEMIGAGLCRSVINARVNRIRRIIKWGVENQMVEPGVLQGLQAVAPLKRGRSAAPDREPIEPVPEDRIDAVIAAAPAHIAAMIRLQRLTGMRPNEVVAIRTRDIDTSGGTWTYTPRSHKTQHHGRVRVVFLGPRAREVLRPFLRTDLDAFVFSPAKAMERWHAERRAARRTPMTPSQAARTREQRPQKSPGERYTTGSYRQAIHRACAAAFPHPRLEAVPRRRLTEAEKRELEAWRREHRWSPNRLRHNAATELRKRFGVEEARVVLGHSTAAVTEIYAERDLRKAAAIMDEVG